ncbi:MAG: hypothetical protein ACYCZF_13565 [Anaerolineae bacterium]
MSQEPHTDSTSLINVLSYGSPNPLPASTALHAGPLSLTLVDGQLRRICLGQYEVLRRIYFSARDPAWRTAPNHITITGQDVSPDGFLITYQAEVRLDALRLDLKATLCGTNDGVISFAFEALALNDLNSNRVGLCVLHPAACAGTACQIMHSDGQLEHRRFPLLVSPHQPFTDIRSITHTIQRGVQAQVEFEGAVFEMEDQRNWSDASFKTYSGQLSAAQPLPIFIAAGTRVSQKVTLRLLGARPTSLRIAPQSSSLTLDERSPQPLPSLGLGLAHSSLPLIGSDLQAIHKLNVQHLRVHLDLGNPLALEAMRQLSDLSLSLELVVTLSPNCANELAELVKVVGQRKARINRWLVYSASNVHLEQACALLRRLTPGVPIGSGSVENLAELNRVHPDLALLDLVCFALNPQVHQTDDDTLVENLGSQRALVATARAIAGEKPLVISPVSLKPRMVPQGHGLKRLPRADETAAMADPRYTSLLGASWLALTLANLSAAGGVASITCYDLIGWDGVMEREGDVTFSARWPELVGAPYPAYHMLTWIGRWAGGEVLPVISSDPLKVGAMALHRNDELGLLVCNLVNQPHLLRLNLPERDWRMKTLHPGNVLALLTDRDFLAQVPDESITPQQCGYGVSLPPYALAFLDSNH